MSNFVFDSDSNTSNPFISYGFDPAQANVLELKSLLWMDVVADKDPGFVKDFPHLGLEALLIAVQKHGLKFRLEVFDGNQE